MTAIVERRCIHFKNLSFLVCMLDFGGVKKILLITLPETNIAPENRPSQRKLYSIPTIHLQVRTVSLCEGNNLNVPPNATRICFGLIRWDY